MTDAAPLDLRHAAVLRRWLVLGAGGAGKTTLAVELSEILGLPLIHLDRHYWRPGWVATPDHEWDARVQALVQGDEWIMDGNYSRTLHLRLPRAQAAILLDPPTPVCLWGVIGRGSVGRGRRRADLADGCSEQLPSFEFLRYVATYKWRSRPKVLRRIQDASHVTLFHVSSRSRARRLLADLRRARSDG